MSPTDDYNPRRLTVASDADPMAAARNGGGPVSDGSAYRNKPADYYRGARADYVDALPRDPNRRILEVGCGAGMTGAMALAAGRCGRYVGIEIDEATARDARENLSDVLHANVETAELPWPPATFDVLVLSEVLEHLVDPWAALARLMPLLRRGGLVFASSPNVCHHAIILNLVRGKWDLEESGVMDRTHLRWFTPATFRRMFEDAGVTVERVGPVARPGPKSRIVDAVTMGAARHLLIKQIDLRGRKA